MPFTFRYYVQNRQWRHLPIVAGTNAQSRKAFMLLATEYPNWKSSLRLGHHDLDVRLLLVRYHSRFFLRVGHETTNASIGNLHFFNKSCHRQTYQNLNDLLKACKIHTFKVIFQHQKSTKSFLFSLLDMEINFQNEIFLKTLIFKVLCFLKNMPNFCRLCS